jgi:3',5'-cyclic AMP phosphodiesterase CpdA
MKKIFAIILMMSIIFTVVGVLSACETDESDNEFTTYTIKADSEFKILQLTDIHMTASEHETIADLRAAGIILNPASGITAYMRDSWALRTVKELIEETEPDFIIVTGDIAYVNSITQILVPIGHTDNLKAMRKFAEYMETFRIPWAATLGNHDQEGDYSRQDIGNYLSNLKYCVFKNGPEDIMGYGNYAVNILNSDGTLNTSLIMMDSNDYRKPDDLTGFSEEDSIHDDQVEWYERTLNRIKEKYSLQTLPNSLLFFHIPLKEYKTARDLYLEEQRTSVDNPDVTWHDGFYGEGIACPAIGYYEDVYYDGGNLFEKILELQSTKATFVGHDHINNIIMEYKGVQFVYGKSIDYTAYAKPSSDICKSDMGRGGTLIALKDKIPFVYDGADNKPIQFISYSGGLYNAYIAAENDE